MPELPEVETIKLDLQKLLKGKTIKSVDINLPKQIVGSVSRFKKQVQNSKVQDVKRRAKTLIIDLNNQNYLIFHLKMTGQLIYKGLKGYTGGGHPIQQNLQDLPNKYSHVIFNFSDGSRLFFNDTRQFGWVKLVSDKELEVENSKFGPEPLDKNFTFSKFKELFVNKKQALKPLLMDPKFIAGIGNIYAQEACFCAGILPTRPANQINIQELKKLYSNIRKILKLAITKKGTSSNDYIDAFGRQGSMQNFLKVYNRAGEKCFKCKSTIKLIRQAQRTTCYCEKCQK